MQPSRIRTVKPELFQHERLYDAERETGLPLRVAFIALFCCCDREGRFQWKPRTLQARCLPFDGVDMSRVLHALVTRGFLVRYACGTDEYGCIPTFPKHQFINGKEAASEIPPPDAQDCVILEVDASVTRDSRVDHAFHKEGKGRDRNGSEGNGREEPPGGDSSLALAVKPAVRRKRSDPAKSAAAWEAYSGAYLQRYGTAPVRNAKVNSLLCQLVDRLGEDAPAVAAWFVRHNAAWYVQKGHSLQCLVADAEKLRTEWATGRKNGSKRTVRTAAEELAYLEQGMDETRGATVPAIAELAASKRLPAGGNGNG